MIELVIYNCIFFYIGVDWFFYEDVNIKLNLDLDKFR